MRKFMKNILKNKFHSIFIIFILSSIFNFYGYSKSDEKIREICQKLNYGYFFFNLIFSLIFLIILYYLNFVQKNNESNGNIED